MNTTGNGSNSTTETISANNGVAADSEAANSTFIGSDTFEVSDNDYDFDRMRDFTEQEEQNAPSPQEKGSEKKQVAEDKEDKPEKNITPSEEEGDEESGQRTDDGSEAEKSAETKDSLEELEEYVLVKEGDRERKIARDAKVEIKINGKKESMTLQEALNKASGAINVDRENTRLGRERKAHEEEVNKFKSEAAVVNAHAQALLDMEDPVEFCEYYAALKGLNPDEVYAGMVKKTLEVAEEWAQMTPRERQLQLELRKHKRVQKQYDAKAKLESDAKEAGSKKERILASIKEADITPEEYENALLELQEKANNGEDLGSYFENVAEITEKDVIKYVALSNINKRVLNAVTSISNEETAKDTDFISKLTRALTRSESLHGKFTDAEVLLFVKEALELDKKVIRENLSKKVEKTTNSKSVNSRKQEEDDDDSDDVTLEEYEERLRSGYY